MIIGKVKLNHYEYFEKRERGRERDHRERERGRERERKRKRKRERKRERDIQFNNRGTEKLTLLFQNWPLVIRGTRVSDSGAYKCHTSSDPPVYIVKNLKVHREFVKE